MASKLNKMYNTMDEVEDLVESLLKKKVDTSAVDSAENGTRPIVNELKPLYKNKNNPLMQTNFS